MSTKLMQMINLIDKGNAKTHSLPLILIEVVKIYKLKTIASNIATIWSNVEQGRQYRNSDKRWNARNRNRQYKQSNNLNNSWRNRQCISNLRKNTRNSQKYRFCGYLKSNQIAQVSQKCLDRNPQKIFYQRLSKTKPMKRHR